MTENPNSQLHLHYFLGNKTEITESFSSETRGQKKQWHFLNANRKELLTQTPIFKKNILQELRWNIDIFKWRKTNKFTVSRFALKELLKGSSSERRNMTSEWNLNSRNERSNRNSKSLSSVKIFKIHLKKQKANRITMSDVPRYNTLDKYINQPQTQNWAKIVKLLSMDL